MKQMNCFICSKSVSYDESGICPRCSMAWQDQQMVVLDPAYASNPHRAWNYLWISIMSGQWRDKKDDLEPDA